MPRSISIKIYGTGEICTELAKRTGFHKDYTRERVRILINTYLPDLEKTGNMYLLTEEELNILASKIQKKKRKPN